MFDHAPLRSGPSSLLLLWLALPPAGAQTPSPGVQVLDLDLAVAGPVALEDDLLLFAASESGQGLDLDGDGDLADTPLFVYRPSSGALVDLGASGSVVDVLAARALYRVREFDDGVDRNGDGDLFDTLLEVYDAASGAFLSPGWAGSDVSAAGDLAAIRVRELDQGATDLNGDGDLADTVLVTVDLTTGVATNLGRAALGLAVEPGGVAFLVPEASQGGTDLNGDGDTADRVLHLWERSSGVVTNTGLAVRLGSLSALGVGRFAFAADEAAQGGVDLNGDGDALDGVLHTVALGGAPPLGLGLATASGFAAAVVGGERLAVFAVDEAAQGGADLNGDGDALDAVAHRLDPGSGRATNLGLAVPAFDAYAVDGARLVLRVSEPDQGASDLDGDGFVQGDVVFTYDHVTGSLTNLGLPASGLALGGSLAVLEVPESSGDLNGDGDQDDVVAVVHDLATGVSRPSGAAVLFPTVEGALVHWGVPEFAQGGVDVNGDGDDQDLSLVAWDATFGRLLVDGLWTETLTGLGGPPDAFLQYVALAVDEAADGGTDLNGDGDAEDRVLAIASLPALDGLVTDADRISVTAGGVQRFALEAGVHLRHRPYVLFGSLSGTLPGTLFGGRLVPLNVDVYTQLVLTDPDAAPFTAFVGFLDRAGRSSAPAFTLPPSSDPALVGVVAHHAFAVLDLVGGLGVVHTSNAVRLELVP